VAPASRRGWILAASALHLSGTLQDLRADADVCRATPRSGLLFYLPLRASRRPSSVNAALSSSGLPLVPQRMTHPRSTARAMAARDSYILWNVAHRIGCPIVASNSL
jgi:hypothetical protein